MSNANLTGQRIAQLREDRGWNHERMVAAVLDHPDLGPAWAVSESTIRRAERGALMTTSSRYAIATVLGKAPSELWGNVPRPTRRRRPVVAPTEVAA